MKYLFEVEYKDGTFFKQNEEDVSLTDPKRSAFFDIKQEEVKRFTLEGNGNTFCVDLTDGHFEVNGVSFFMHDESLTDFRLIYFRRHRHQFNRETREELSHEVTFRFGWQATLDGKNIQRVMEI